MRAAEQRVDGATTPARQQTPRWRRWLRFWWAPALLVVLVLGLVSSGRDETGAILQTSDLTVAELRVGDCFDLKDPTAELIGQVEAKPCAQPHQYEVFFRGDLPDGEYPGAEGIDQYLNDNCVPAFGAYVGLAYEPSRLDIFYFTPPAELWSSSDQSVQCAVYDPNLDQLTGSLRGAAR